MLVLIVLGFTIWVGTVLLPPRSALHHLTPCDLLLALFVIQRIRIHTFGLRHKQEGGNGTQDVASEEDPENVCHANLTGRAQVVEQHAR